MSKWLVKKTINDNIKKNDILEETELIHSEAIYLSEYSGGFGFFSKGKNFKCSNGKVVKLLGKRSDLLDHIQEYEEPKTKTFYRWKGDPRGNLLYGKLYEQTVLRDFDRSLILDRGLNKLYFTDGDQVVVVQGSKKNI